MTDVAYATTSVLDSQPFAVELMEHRGTPSSFVEQKKIRKRMATENLRSHCTMVSLSVRQAA
ncbi:hypothetical protein Vi05172_g4809 [Venturia inaequalis]|nr:hypothetical protein Vi05172_g4809 [Venturia inaequalis]